MAIVVWLFFAYFCSVHFSVAAMETLCALIYLSSAGIAIYTKKWIWPTQMILVAFGGLLFAAVASFIANSLPLSHFIKYMGEFRWILTYLGLLQFYNLFYDKIDFKKLIFSAQCILIIAGLYSYYQFFSGRDIFRANAFFHALYFGSPYFRPNAFFNLPTTYAYASSMFFSLSLAFWLREKPLSQLHERVTRAYLFISSTNVLLSFTRAAWIAFYSNVITLVYLINKKFCLRIILVTLIMIPLLYNSMDSFQNRFDSIFDSTYMGNHNRIYLWKANWNIFKENPWVGIGFNENLHKIDHYLVKFSRPEVMRSHPHNTYLNFLAGLGLLGFAFFMLFIIVNLKNTIQGIRLTPHGLHKTIYIGALGAQMVLLIGGFTECNFEDIELNHQYILYMALIEYLRQQDFPEKLKPKSNFKNTQVLSA